MGKKKFSERWENDEKELDSLWDNPVDYDDLDYENEEEEYGEYDEYDESFD